ncbi:MAG: hypothetical protein E6J74_19000 [Deltaproteobacteria bacterium]|nr:MAG: hypothetical protein E6J74_19000 [Deltaproteobacteria bacterium]
MWLVDRLSGSQNVKWAERMLLAGCLSLCASAVIFGSLLVRNEQQYVRLAESFLSGKLYFTSIPAHLHDTAAFGQRHYWPLGPLPAVLLMPFVSFFRLIGADFYLGYASLPLTLASGWLCFRIAQKCGRSNEESAWLTLAFCGSSSYLSVGVISMSWPFAQIVAVCLIFLAIDEWLTRRRWWLLGFLLGLTAAARISAGLNIALFTGAALFCEKKGRAKIVAALAVGFTIPIFFLAAYNFIRFGSMFETGYSYQLPSPGDFPTISLTNVIPHLLIFLFGPPTTLDKFPFFAANTYGMSVLLLSPWLFFLGSLKMDRFNYLALANCAAVLLVVLAWRSTGQLQVGYRFSLDFLPIITFLLARSGFNAKKISWGFKVLTILGFILTLYFLVSFIDLLPQG